MAKKITKNTRLRRGDIVRAGESTLLGIVVRHEKYLSESGFYAFSRSPDDRKFIKENDGVDLYQRHHINDLAKMNAEIISPIELVLMYENAQCTIRALQGEYVPYQNDTLENCIKKRDALEEKAKKYQFKIDELMKKRNKGQSARFL